MWTALFVIMGCEGDALPGPTDGVTDPVRLQGAYDIVEWLELEGCAPEAPVDVTQARPPRLRLSAADDGADALQATVCDVGDCTSEFDPWLPETYLEPVAPGHWDDRYLFYGIEGPDDERCTAYVAERTLIEQPDGVTIEIRRLGEVSYPALPDAVCSLDEAIDRGVFEQPCASFERFDAVAVPAGD